MLHLSKFFTFIVQSIYMWQQILRYLYLRKRDENAPRNLNVALMHGMNRISIIVFLLGLIVMLFRLFRH